MVHVIFNGSDVRLDNFYQVGGSGLSFFEGLPPHYQRGYGYFAGYPAIRQRGNGLGDIFRSLWRVLRPLAVNVGQAIRPLAKEAGKALGEEGIAASAKFLNKVVEGNDPKHALASEAKDAASRLLDRTNSSLQNKIQQLGSGRKRNRTYKKGRPLTGHVSLKPISYNNYSKNSKSIPKEDYIGRTVILGNKRLKRDSLGYY